MCASAARIALSIDTAQIVDAVMQGTARPNNSALPLGSPFYSERAVARLRAEHRGSQEAAAGGRLSRPADQDDHQQALQLRVRRRRCWCRRWRRPSESTSSSRCMDWAAQLDRYNRGDYQSMAFIYSARLDPSLELRDADRAEGDAAAQGLGQSGGAGHAAPVDDDRRHGQAAGAVRRDAPAASSPTCR